MDRRSKARVYNFMLRFCHCWSSCLSFLFSKSNVNNFFFNFFYVKTLSGPVSDPSKLPKWNYDGSQFYCSAGTNAR
jgi:hypothetical protein